MKGYYLPVLVDTVPLPRIAAITLLTMSAVSVSCLLVVPNLWMVALTVLQFLGISPVIKEWFDHRHYFLLHFGAEGQVTWSTADGDRIDANLHTMADIGAWILIIIIAHGRHVPLVVRRQGNEEHFHRLRLLARDL